MRFILKHPRFWGDLFIAAAVIGSNAGSAWAGAQFEILRGHTEWSAPPNSGFQILLWTVYPLAVILLVLGLYLRSKYKRS